MQPENPNDLATIHWEAFAEVLRASGVHEDEIFKGGKHFKTGFSKGFECGFRHKQEDEDEEELTPAIGFQQETEDEDED